MNLESNNLSYSQPHEAGFHRVTWLLTFCGVVVLAASAVALATAAATVARHFAVAAYLLFCIGTLGRIISLRKMWRTHAYHSTSEFVPTTHLADTRATRGADCVSIAVLILLSTFFLRGILSATPLTQWDYLGLGKDWKAGLVPWSSRGLGYPRPLDPYALLAYPVAAWSPTIGGNLIVWSVPYITTLTSYSFLRSLGRRPIAACIGAFVYLVNPIVFARYTQGHMAILVGYALLPAVIQAVLSTVRVPGGARVPLRTVVIMGGLIATASIGDGHILYLITVTSVALFALSFFAGDRASIGNGLRLFVASVCLALGILLPRLQFYLTESSTGWAERITSPLHVLALSARTDLVNLLRLIGEPAAGFLLQAGYYNMNITNSLGFALPLAAFSTVFTIHGVRGRESTVWSALALTGLALAPGTHYLPQGYLFLYEKLPFFFAFRESSKFLIIVALSYSVLVSILVDESYRRLPRTRIPVGSALGAILILATLIANSPLLDGEAGMRGVRTRSIISQDLKRVGSWLDARTDEFRVIVLPTDDYIYAAWQHISQRPLLILDRGSLVFATPHGFSFTSYLINTLLTEPDQAAAGLGVAGVRFLVLWPGSAHASFNFVTPRIGMVQRDFVTSLLASELYRPVFQTGEFRIFENKCYLGSVMILTSTRAIVGTKAPSIPSLCSAILPKILPDALDTALMLDRPWASRFKSGEAIGAFQYAENVDPSDLNGALRDRWVTSFPYEYMRAGPYAWGERTLAPAYATTESRAGLRVPLQIREDGRYYLRLRLHAHPGGSILRLFLDNAAIGTITDVRKLYQGFAWFAAGPLRVSRGRHTLEVRANSGWHAIDSIIVAPDKPIDTTVTPHQGIKRIPPVPANRGVTIQRENEVMRIRGLTTPSTVVLAQSFHPNWKAWCDGKALLPIRMDFAVGFNVVEPCASVTIDFGPNETVRILLGSTALMVTLIVLTAVLMG